MTCTLYRNNTERLFCIQVEGLDSVPSIRSFNRNDDGVNWTEFGDPDIYDAAVFHLNKEESIGFLSIISRSIPNVAELTELAENEWEPSRDYNDSQNRNPM
jgi:hypothetical protein